MKKAFLYSIIITIGLISMHSCKAPALLDETAKISKDEFFYQPFGFEITLNSFAEKFPKAKASKVIKRNEHYPTKSDTIHKFTAGKSSIFFYQSFNGRSFLLAANIIDDSFPLRNNVQPGLSRAALCNYMQEFPCNGGDIYYIQAHNAEFKLFFNEQQVLTRIYIQYFPD